MRRRRSCCRVGLALAGTLVLAGCRQTPKTSPALPAVQLDVSSIAGSLLGPTPTTAPATRPATRVGAVGVEVTWVAVTRLPSDLLDPLDAHATLVSAPMAGGPVLASGRQTAAARFGDGQMVDALLARLIARTDGPVAQIGHQVGVIVPGSTTTFRLAAAAEAKRPQRSVTVSLNLLPVADWPATRPASQPATGPVTRPTNAPAIDNGGDDAAKLDAAFNGPTTTRSTTADLVETPADYLIGPNDTIHVTISSPLPPPVGAVTVALEGFRDTVNTDEDAPATRPAVVTTPETAYLDDLPLAPGSRYVLALPSRFDPSPWRGIVAFIDLTPAPEDAAALADAQFGRPSATQPASQPAAERTLTRAVDALQTNADPRPPLLFLATATRATIAADAILIADRPLLDRLRSELLQYIKDHDAADAAALGWHLDRSAVLALCSADQAGPLAPELAAVLTVHGGEVGRHLDAMADAARNVGSAADLKARLIGENTIALEDNSPAARVRAFDWLKGQGRAPDGYDPLADARARRAAINQSISTTQGTR